jgi:hypothetical protein
MPGHTWELDLAKGDFVRITRNVVVYRRDAEPFEHYIYKTARGTVNCMTVKVVR